MLFGAAEPPDPAAARNEVRRRVADGVQRRLGRRIRRPLAEIGAVLPRRFVGVGARGFVQARDLRADGGAMVQVPQIVGIGLGLQKHRGDHLTTQVEVFQRRARRGGEACADLFGPAHGRTPRIAAGQTERRHAGHRQDHTKQSSHVAP